MPDDMNLDKAIARLLCLARSPAASDRVPYAFEQRIMARLKTLSPIDPWTLWARALWRSATLCLAVMMLSAAWWIWPAPDPASPFDFSQEFQHAVFAQAAQVDYAE